MKVLRRLVAVLGLSAAATSVGAPTQEGYLHARIAELESQLRNCGKREEEALEWWGAALELSLPEE